MTTQNPMMLTRSDFEQLLDVYGADRTRWPLGARAGAAALLASDIDARRLLAEAIALDAVLAKGQTGEPVGDPAIGALAARVMAAVAATPRVAMVNPAPVLRRSVSMTGDKAAKTSIWRGAAMLAASLVLGVFVGQSQLGAYALPKLAAIAGLSLETPERLALADIELDATEVD